MGFLPLGFSDEKPEGEGSEEDEEMSMYGLTSSMTVPLESSVRVPAESVKRVRRMRARCTLLPFIAPQSFKKLEPLHDSECQRDFL